MNRYLIKKLEKTKKYWCFRILLFTIILISNTGLKAQITHNWDKFAWSKDKTIEYYYDTKSIKYYDNAKIASVWIMIKGGKIYNNNKLTDFVLKEIVIDKSNRTYYYNNTVYYYPDGSLDNDERNTRESTILPEQLEEFILNIL
jgi:hypothetical protein